MKAMLLFTGLLICSHVPAQWSSNTKLNNPVCTAPNDQAFAKMIPDGRGGVIITWTDERLGSQDQNVYAQRIDANGVTKWANNGIVISNAVYNQKESGLISDGRGGAILCWSDGRTDPSNLTTDIYAQRIDSNGKAQWKANGVVVCNATHRQSASKILPDGLGGAFILWEDNRNLMKTDIYMQRISASGERQWETTGVPVCVMERGQYNAKIISDANGGVLVAWSDDRNVQGQGESTDIYAQRLDLNGNALWTANGRNICTALKGQYLSDMMSDGAGGAILTWIDGRDYNHNEDDIYAQRINGNGSVLWQADGIALCTAAHEQSDPKLTIDGRGGAIITWYDLRGGGDYDGDIYAQRVDASGVTKWTADGALVAKADRYRLFPSIINDDHNGAIIAWQDYRNGSSEIYAQLINGGGKRQWSLGGVAVCTAPVDRFFSALVTDGRGGAIACWQDYRNGAYTNADIFASRIPVSTTDFAAVFENAKPGERDALLVYPNPATTSIRVANANGTVSIADMGGVIFKKIDCDGSANIDISDLKPGYYYCRSGTATIKFLKTAD